MKSWLPWRLLLRSAARRQGFIDPFAFLARLRKLAQPSEVQEPIELIRAGAVFHARGLINTKVLQNNLDWIWPYWVARQFDPHDPSFLPRAFSFSHVNLTHRNWSALGLPGMLTFPIVDPRGMLTPLLDGWSLDWWFVPENGAPIFPSQATDAEQRLELEPTLAVTTVTRADDAELTTRAWVEPGGNSGAAPEVVYTASVRSRGAGQLVLAVRPANPEGIRFIDRIHLEAAAMQVDHDPAIALDPAPAGFAVSSYAIGDVRGQLHVRKSAGEGVHCTAGLATAAAIFSAPAHGGARVTARVPLPSAVGRPRPKSKARAPVEPVHLRAWSTALAATPRIQIPDRQWAQLFDGAVRTVVLLAPDDIFPGPYTYRRFWFRDACLIMNAMLALNLEGPAAAALGRFPLRQRVDGYFHSQEGEWDSNGEVLWIAERLERTMGTLLPAPLLRSLERGANWIMRKRRTARDERCAGLLPPGFSAEHLGPNDYYYWDNFWGVAGLQAIAAMERRRGDERAADKYARDADDYARAIRASLDAIPDEIRMHGIPASPHRRMDAGAIGSMVADYPLQLDAISADEMLRTVDWIWNNCRFGGGFFQEMIHSGINAYLTLALAQTFLRHGDERYLELISAVANLASPTGHWPEAIHPRTGGGCMGDGQHAWAAAEWILMLRALFVREEADCLVIGAGLPSAWFEQAAQLSFGPTNTVWGPVEITFTRQADGWRLKLGGSWHGQPPRIQIAATAFEPATVEHVTREIPLAERAADRAFSRR